MVDHRKLNIIPSCFNKNNDFLKTSSQKFHAKMTDLKKEVRFQDWILWLFWFLGRIHKRMSHVVTHDHVH